MKNVVIPDSVTIIDYEMFKGNEMVNLVIPDSVERLENDAFEDCAALQTVRLGTGLKSGGSRVFMGCKNIKKVFVKSIDSLFNYRCDNYGSPLQYGARLYVDEQLCTNINIPIDAKYPWIVYPLIGCGSIKTITINRETPCFSDIVKLVEDINNGGERLRHFVDGPIRRWKLIIE